MLKRFLDPRYGDARKTLATLAVLLAIASVSSKAFRYHPRTDTPLKKIARTLKKRGLNQEAVAKQTAGYYEGLLDQAALVTQVSGRGWLDWRFWFGERQRRIQFGTQTRRSQPGFIRYDLPPNANVPEIDERRRLITNSQGLADQEYSQARTPGTWRVALIGDSVTRGTGTEFGTNFESTLERALNEHFAGQKYSRYEILNFGVQGYQLTHLVDVTLDRVPPYKPDVYAVALTDRSVFRVWADHIASVIHAGVDLKYDFLKQIAREADLTPNLSDALINAKLARYRIPVLRWALDEMKQQAARDGASLVVLLVPSPDDAEMQIDQFREVKVILDEKKIRTLDLLETFVDVEDLAPVRVSAADRHPNEAGHKMLFDAIWKQLERDPGVRAVFTGMGATGH